MRYEATLLLLATVAMAMGQTTPPDTPRSNDVNNDLSLHSSDGNSSEESLEPPPPYKFIVNQSEQQYQSESPGSKGDETQAATNHGEGSSGQPDPSAPPRYRNRDIIKGWLGLRPDQNPPTTIGLARSPLPESQQPQASCSETVGKLDPSYEAIEKYYFRDPTFSDSDKKMYCGLRQTGCLAAMARLDVYFWAQLNKLQDHESLTTLDDNNASPKFEHPVYQALFTNSPVDPNINYEFSNTLFLKLLQHSHKDVPILERVPLYDILDSGAIGGDEPWAQLTFNNLVAFELILKLITGYIAKGYYEQVSIFIELVMKNDYLKAFMKVSSYKTGFNFFEQAAFVALHIPKNEQAMEFAGRVISGRELEKNGFDEDGFVKCFDRSSATDFAKEDLKQVPKKLDLQASKTTGGHLALQLQEVTYPPCLEQPLQSLATMSRVLERSALKVPTQILLAPAETISPEPHYERHILATKADPASTLQDYLVAQRSYRQQYANLYYLRLSALKEAATTAAHDKWLSPAGGDGSSKASPSPLPTFAAKVTNIPPGEICFVVGTVYCDKKLRPNVLDDLSKELWITAPPERSTYATDEDAYFLEDESSRITLVGDMVHQAPFVTGMVVGLLGCENLTGDFEVHDVCYPGLGPQHSLPSPVDGSDTLPPAYVALVSGLNFGDPAATANAMAYELLKEFVTGQLGASGEQALAAQVTKVVVLGNSLSTGGLEAQCEKLHITDEGENESDAAKDRAAAKDGLHHLDQFLGDLCASVSVALLPGDHDPVNQVLPQQPLHISLFPTAARHSTLTSVTNPARLDLQGLSLLGVSGQTIADACKYCPQVTPLEMAELTLRCRHITPSAPDTLWCYPFVDKDPFVLTETPHIYAIGNQSQFASQLVQGSAGQVCRVVCVPAFSTTQTIVLVDLHTLAVHPMSFTCAF
ncbi:DNA polymerase delta small subunit Cdc1 [Dimargaris xerosporica]|nr:DNA polymerase delta small subunit Cdc1 [Dimargaris xerosporica]